MVSFMTPADTSRGIAANVSAALRAASISQRDAAARTGIAINTLSRRLTGHSPFSVTELALLADILGTTVPNLVTVERAA